MTDHDYFIFNLERKQARIKEAIKAYKKEYLSTADNPPKRKKSTRGDNLKTKLLGSK
tara:strand:+ start:181 stop:351 length:171 start_codon:yes stop_codon:yes gene_type:complete